MDMRLKNKRYENYLGEQLETRQFTGFMLFVGQKGTGKNDMASYFAKNIVCENGINCQGCAGCALFESGNHPDVISIGGGGRIKIAEIRGLNKKLNLKPYQAGHKIAIIKDAHQMTDESANAMLKLLEEPPEKSIIILTAEDKALLPETIVSRSQVVDFGINGVQQEDFGSASDAREILQPSSVAEKFNIIQKYGKDKAMAGNLMDCLETILRQAILAQNRTGKETAGIHEAEALPLLLLLARSRQYLNNNLSIRFVLENLALNIQRSENCPDKWN